LKGDHAGRRVAFLVFGRELFCQIFFLIFGIERVRDHEELPKVNLLIFEQAPTPWPR
jgi:hypothetical protein